MSLVHFFRSALLLSQELLQGLMEISRALVNCRSFSSQQSVDDEMNLHTDFLQHIIIKEDEYTQSDQRCYILVTLLLLQAKKTNSNHLVKPRSHG